MGAVAKISIRIGCLICAAWGVLSPMAGSAQTNVEPSVGVAELSAFFEGARVRTVGSPGNEAIEKRVGAAFKASGFPNGNIVFPAPAFDPGRTTLVLEGLDPIPLLPLHPMLMRPGNFATNDLTAPLIYLGHGSYEDLEAVKGLPLDGAIVLMEFDCGDTWQRFLRFGVKGFVFIGGDQYFYLDAVKKLSRAEVSIPRFFVNAEQGQLLREQSKGQAPRAHVRAEPSRWHNTTLQDLWVFIPGSDPTLEREVCVFVAPLDSNGIVPELAEGAQGGANLFLLMKLLDDFKANPPARSVLLAAVNGHSQYFLGERMLAWHLLAPSTAVEGVRNGLSAEIRYQELMINEYGKLKLDGAVVEDENLLIRLRTLEDKSTGKNVTVKTPIVLRVKKDLNLLKTHLLLLQQGKTIAAESGRTKEDLRAEVRQVVNVLTLFNKVGIKTQLSDLNPTETGILRRHVATILNENKVWIELNRRDLEQDIQNGAIRDLMASRTVSMVFTLDLRWRTPQIGFCSSDGSAKESAPWTRRFGANSAKLAATVFEGIGAPSEVRFLDTMTMVGGLSESYYFSESSSSIGHFLAAGTPAVSLQNAFGDTGTAFTPADRFENLDDAVVAPLMSSIPSFFRAILDDASILSPGQLPPVKPPAPLWSIQIKTFEFDPFSASSIPDLPIPGTFALLYPQGVFASLVAGDVVSAYTVMTDARAGRYVIGIKDATQPPIATAAYRLAPDGVSVDRAIDAGDPQERMSSNLSVPGTSYTLSLFPCKEIVLFERNDSSAVAAGSISRRTYLVLDGAQNAAPRRYGLGGISSLSLKLVPWTTGPASVYIEPRDHVKIMTDSMRLALNATDEAPTGLGFGSGAEMGPDFFARAARDMSLLNRDRLKDLRGVSNQLVEESLRRGETMLKEMKAALAHQDYNGYLRALYEVMGCQVKAYGQVSATRNDMLKAVVFYMALLLPFCFFVQRLLFKTVKIEFQMLLFSGLFIVTFVLFRTIHPAFHVARSPEAIFIAFIMGALALFVISILHGRFEGEMQFLFRSLGIQDAAQIGYSTASQQAMLIGVNNMKRRRVRTSLTTATIVLVTFTMLAFSSISKKMSPTVIPITKETPYTGIFYQWPGSLQMDEASLQTVVDILAPDCVSVVVRRWLLPPKNPAGQASPFSLRSGSGITLQVEAVLGMSLADNGFLGPMPLLGESRYFSSDNAEEVILPARAAEALNLSLQDVGKVSLTFQGRLFKLVGIVHDERFQALRDLSHHSILPIQRVATLGLKQSEAEASVNLDPTAADETGVFYVDMASLILLPEGTAKSLGAQPFSVSLRLKEDVSLWRVVDRILTSTQAKFFVGSRNPFPVGEGGDDRRVLSAGVYYIGSGYKTSIGGLARLIIPLLIASTIILNTMLGSVYERKSEIAVFNAVGLNPTHIGMFFLAEAFVYSVIGSVGGYLIGQMFSLGLVRFNLFSDINLNFSSLSVMYVILFTVAVVLLSTLYPAIMATRAAVPSGKRKWSMPPHDGHQMNVVFPFIYQPELAPALVAYLEKYFATFTEASVGDLIATPMGRSRKPDDRGRDSYALEYEIAPAPYDLGVTQHVQFLAAFDDLVQSYRIRMVVTRISGQDTNWVTTNKPFLDGLRKYLMRWRNLSPAERAAYAEQAKILFGDAPGAV
jgi:hypothetical protein